MATPPKLKLSRKEALKLLSSSIREGEGLLQKRVNTTGGLEKLKETADEWLGGNLVLLNDLLTTRAYMREYEEVLAGTNWRAGRKPLGEEVNRFRSEIYQQITVLDSIRKRVELLEEAGLAPAGGKSAGNNRVFVVHGHDHSARHAVEAFLLRLGLQPVVLADQANGGKTIIEKFESNSADVAYAVVILTPDDAGHAASGSEEILYRARQNVIFELGYFVAKLGRQRVCPLYVHGVELPSDYHGVVYVPFDDRDRWHIHLGKELREAGLPVDLNKL